MSSIKFFRLLSANVSSDCFASTVGESLLTEAYIMFD